MNEYIGGYLEGQKSKFIALSPDVIFMLELQENWEFLENFIYTSEFDAIKRNIDMFNHKLYKNTALILLGFIVYKYSNFREISVNALNDVYTTYEIQPLLKQYQISIYDLLRYSRFFALNGIARN